MYRTHIIAALILSGSFGCHAGWKNTLKKIVPCVHAKKQPHKSKSSDSSEFAHDSFSSYPSLERTSSSIEWNRELYIKMGILPEDIAKNPFNPAQEACDRQIREAME